MDWKYCDNVTYCLKLVIGCSLGFPNNSHLEANDTSIFIYQPSSELRIWWFFTLPHKNRDHRPLNQSIFFHLL